MSKLTIYNEALGALTERKLLTLTEAREPRRVLDDFWDGVVNYCIGRGFWKFAKRTVLIDASTSITPEFGYTYAFTKPTDWVRTYVVSENEQLDPPLWYYIDENGLWYANSTTLYVSYISKDTAFGLDISLWPEAFRQYVIARLALKAGPRITKNRADIADLTKIERAAQDTALGIDAMDGPPMQPPKGSWVQSRGGNSTSQGNSRWDGTWR
jgi:hypothetical protein